jgi:hypothetical protein
MRLAPLATTLNAMLSGPPFAIPEELDRGAIDEQIKRAIGAPMLDVDSQRLLTLAQGRVIRHRPV